MRLTPAWIEQARRTLTAPVLERLRFFESIPPDPNISSTEICEALDLDDPDVHSLSYAIGHLIPAGRFFEVLERMEGVHAVMMPEHLYSFATAAALREIQRPASPFLLQALNALNREWQEGDRDAVLHAMPRVAALAEHSDPEAACRAAVLALTAKVLSPAVVVVLRRRLRELPNLLERRKAGDKDIGELGRGELFWGIAKAGETLRELATDFLLHPDNSLHATVAAVGVNAQSLAPAIEKLYHDTPAKPSQHLRSAEAFSIIRARSYYAHATWCLGGPGSRFDEAVSLVGDHLIARRHLAELMRVSAPTRRMLQALLELGKGTGWQADVLRIFAGFGPAAAGAVSAMALPDMSDPAYPAHVAACWRCGVHDAATARKHIEQKLAAHDWTVWDDGESGVAEAWQLYLELDPDAERICSALALLDPEDVHPLEGLGRPAHGLRLLTAIHQSGHHGLVEALWRQCADKSLFWSALHM